MQEGTQKGGGGENQMTHKPPEKGRLSPRPRTVVAMCVYPQLRAVSAVRANPPPFFGSRLITQHPLHGQGSRDGKTPQYRAYPLFQQQQQQQQQALGALPLRPGPLFLLDGCSACAGDSLWLAICFILLGAVRKESPT